MNGGKLQLPDGFEEDDADGGGEIQAADALLVLTMDQDKLAKWEDNSKKCSGNCGWSGKTEQMITKRAT